MMSIAQNKSKIVYNGKRNCHKNIIQPIQSLMNLIDKPLKKDRGIENHN